MTETPNADEFARRYQPLVLTAFGALICVSGGVMVAAEATVEHVAATLLGALCLACGLALLASSRAIRVGVIGVVIVQVIAGMMAHRLDMVNRATALASLAGISELLLIVGKAGKARTATAVACLLFVVGLTMHGTLKVWQNRTPDGARIIDVDVFAVVDESSWVQRLGGRQLPDNVTLSTVPIPTRTGSERPIENLVVAPVSAETLTSAIEGTTQWARSNIQLRPDEHFALAWEPAFSHLIGYVIKGAPVLTLKDVTAASVMPPADGGHWQVAVTFTRSGAEKLSSLQRAQPEQRLALALEGLIRFGPALLTSPYPEARMVLDLGWSGTEADAKLIARALQGALLTRNPPSTATIAD